MVENSCLQTEPTRDEVSKGLTLALHIAEGALSQSRKVSQRQCSIQQVEGARMGLAD